MNRRSKPRWVAVQTQSASVGPSTSSTTPREAGGSSCDSNQQQPNSSEPSDGASSSVAVVDHQPCCQLISKHLFSTNKAQRFEESPPQHFSCSSIQSSLLNNHFARHYVGSLCENPPPGVDFDVTEILVKDGNGNDVTDVDVHLQKKSGDGKKWREFFPPREVLLKTAAQMPYILFQEKNQPVQRQPLDEFPWELWDDVDHVLIECKQRMHHNTDLSRKLNGWKIVCEKMGFDPDKLVFMVLYDTNEIADPLRLLQKNHPFFDCVTRPVYFLRLHDVHLVEWNTHRLRSENNMLNQRLETQFKVLNLMLLSCLVCVIGLIWSR